MKRSGLLAVVMATAALVLLGVAALGAAGFEDDEGSVHEPAIDALATADILDGTGCGEGLFCPDEPSRRWVMAVWLTRALGESPGTSPVRFADVDPEQWWASHVERIAESGITAGCATGLARYCPDDPVTWGQMATFVARVLDLEPRPDPIENGGVTRPEVDFEAVAVGRSHSCGLRADGTVACWGGNASGQADPPDGLFTVITAGYEHSCGLHRDGEIACWGGNRYGQLNLPDGRFGPSHRRPPHLRRGCRRDHHLQGQEPPGPAQPPGGVLHRRGGRC